MGLDLAELLRVAIVAILVAVAVLLVMVHFELGPKGGLTRHRRWLLTAALGSGVIAFGLKIALIVVISRYPEIAIGPSHQPPQVGPAHKPQPVVANYQWQALPRQESFRPLLGAGNYVWEALPESAPEPADNPAVPARVALGERLFFDPRLSRDGTLSCASCHDVKHGAGIDGRAVAEGINGQLGGRNTPTVWNAAFQGRLFWDGRAATLEEQALGPIFNPLEMGMDDAESLLARLRDDETYPRQFAAAFGSAEAITLENLAAAIAAYERTLITPDTPYDRFVRGDLEALTPRQQRGMVLFAAVGCVQCHRGANFSVAAEEGGRAALRLFPAIPTPFETRYTLTADSGAAPEGSERGVWRVPSLRNVALTAPYFHNGSVTELREAVRIMAAVQLGYSGRYLRWSDQERRWREVGMPALADDDIDAIVAFLQALSSDTLVAQQAMVNFAADGEVSYAVAFQ